MMKPDGSIVPLTEAEASELQMTGEVRGVAGTLVRVDDIVTVNGHACRVLKITAKDIILRPMPFRASGDAP